MTLQKRGLIILAFCLSLFALNWLGLLAQDADSPMAAIPPGPITLVTLGDSLTEGEGDQLALGGYPGRLLTLIEAVRPGSTLTNVGHSGWNSDSLINGDQGLPSELDEALTVIQAAVERGEPAVALVWIGSNDLFYLYEYGDPDAAAEADDLTHYEANLDLIVSTLNEAGAIVLIAQLDDQSQRPVTQAGLAFTGISKAEIESMSQQVQRYNEVIATTATEYEVATVDFYQTTIFTDVSTLSDDGNHPNPDGYDIIAQRWFDALKPGLEGASEAAPSPTPALLDDRLLEDTALLDDTPCAAPCWLNIIPGETSWRDARAIIEDDGRFGPLDEIKDEHSEVRLMSFTMKDSQSPTDCCRIYSTMDGKGVAQILTLLAPDQISLGDVIAKYGDPASGAGANVTDSQGLISLFYVDVPMVVYVFVPGIEEGTLAEDSQIVGAIYLSPDDIHLIETTPGLHTWQGYGPVAEWLDAPPDVTPSAQATAES